MWLSQFKNGKDYSQQRNRLSIQGVINPLNQTHTQSLLRKAQQHLRQVKLKARELRDQHLEDRVALANLQGNTTKAKAVTHIKRVEALKKMHHNIRSITRERQQRSFTQLIIPHENDQLVLTSAEEMIPYLLRRNRAHFGQAQGKPFTVPPLNTVNTIQQARDMPPDVQIPEAANAILQYLTHMLETYIKGDKKTSMANTSKVHKKKEEEVKRR